MKVRDTLEYEMRIEVTFGPSKLLRDPNDKRRYSHRIFLALWHGEGTVVYLMHKPPKVGKGKARRTARLSEHMLNFANHYFALALADALKAMDKLGLPTSVEVVEK